MKHIAEQIDLATQELKNATKRITRKKRRRSKLVRIEYTRYIQLKALAEELGITLCKLMDEVCDTFLHPMKRPLRTELLKRFHNRHDFWKIAKTL